MEQAWASFGNGRFQGITEGVGVGTDTLEICLLLSSLRRRMNTGNVDTE